MQAVASASAFMQSGAITVTERVDVATGSPSVGLMVCPTRPRLVSRKLRSYENRLKKISSDFSKLIDGVSDIDSLSPEDREIIEKIQEISSLLSTSNEDSKS